MYIHDVFDQNESSVVNSVYYYFHFLFIHYKQILRNTIIYVTANKALDDRHCWFQQHVSDVQFRIYRTGKF